MLAKILYYCACIALNRIFLIFPTVKNRVLFLSDVRGEPSGNFKFVYDAICGNGYDIKFSLKKDRRIRRSLAQWLKQCYWLATSAYILLDDYSVSTAYLHVRKNQELVQLWHSSGAYKKFAHSRAGAQGDIKRVHSGYKRYTKTITSSEFVRPCFAEAFSIPLENVLATGIPRTDIFFDEEYIKGKKTEIYSDYPALKGKKVVLFAPTYRATRVEDADYAFDRFDPARLARELGDGYAVLIKWHPALYNNLKLGKVRGYTPEQCAGCVYDVSESREINDFLLVTDILVTDYSSVIFDYALLGKPIVYFIYDLEEYQNGRGLYYPFEDYVYGLTARNMRELISAVKEEKLCEEKRAEFIRKFVEANDGKATERAVGSIFGR